MREELNISLPAFLLRRFLRAKCGLKTHAVWLVVVLALRSCALLENLDQSRSESEAHHRISSSALGSAKEEARAKLNIIIASHCPRSIAATITPIERMEGALSEVQVADRFGDAYDQPKRTKSDGSDVLPSDPPDRYLTNWFLIKPSGSNSPADIDPSTQPRHPLPENNVLTDEYIFYGHLVLNPAKTPVPVAKNHLPVRITGTSKWSIDRTKAGRGIWITSPSGCYKLMAPDETRIELKKVQVLLEGNDDDGAAMHLDETATLPNGGATLPSQSDLHLTLRARFGLLSNLLDLMSEPYNNNTNNYVPVHARRSPANIHALLSPNEETYQKFNSEREPLNREPFDLELLERCPGFVRKHLLNYHPLLHEGCAFMKRLLAMTLDCQEKKMGGGSSSSAALLLGGDTSGGAASGATGGGKVVYKGSESRKHHPWTADDYLASSLEAEERGQRTSWGDLIRASGKMIKPNRLIDIEIRNAARGAAISYKSTQEARAAARRKQAEVEKAEATARAAKEQKKDNDGPTPAAADAGATKASAATAPASGTAVPKKRAVAAAALPVEIPRKKAAVAARAASAELEDTDEEEEGQIVEEQQQPAQQQQGDSRARTSPAALITPTPPGKPAAAPPAAAAKSPQHHPPPPPVAQNPIPRAPRRSPGAEAGASMRSGPGGMASSSHPPQNQNCFPPIFFMTSSGRPQFSAASMVQAIRFFSPYLSPTPRDEELGGSYVNYQRYSIRQDKLWSFLDNIVQNSSVLSLEAMLLSVDCFGRTETEMAFRCLLTKKPKADARSSREEVLPVRTLFVVWLDHVLRMFDQTCRSTTAPGQGRMQGQQVPVDNNKRVEVMTAIAIINLIRRFSDCVKGARQLDDLKTEFGVDWIDLCNKTLMHATRHHLDGLSKTCYFVRAQLDRVKAMEVDVSESLLNPPSAKATATDPTVIDREAEEIAQQFERRQQTHVSMQNTEEPRRVAREQRASEASGARVSALVLPRLDQRDWMLVGAQKYHPCKFFDRKNYCKNGSACKYAHVYRPPRPLPEDVPSESALHFIYAYDRGYPLRPTDFHVVSETGSDGRMWHTVALKCPKDQTIYPAAGGLGSHVNFQGVHFYSTVREAMAAVAGIVISALRAKERIERYGPFELPSETEQLAKPAAGRADVEPPTTIALPHQSLTRAQSAPPGGLMAQHEDDGSSISSKGISVASAQQLRVSPPSHKEAAPPTHAHYVSSQANYGVPPPPPQPLPDQAPRRTGAPIAQAEQSARPARPQAGVFGSMIPEAERVVVLQSESSSDQPSGAAPTEKSSAEKQKSPHAASPLAVEQNNMKDTAPPEEQKKPPAALPHSVVERETMKDAAPTIEQKKPTDASVTVAKWTKVGRKAEPKAAPHPGQRWGPDIASSANKTAAAAAKKQQKADVSSLQTLSLAAEEIPAKTVKAPQPVPKAAFAAPKPQVGTSEEKVGATLTVEDAVLLNSPLVEKIRKVQDKASGAKHASAASKAKAASPNEQNVSNSSAINPTVTEKVQPKKKTRKEGSPVCLWPASLEEEESAKSRAAAKESKSIPEKEETEMKSIPKKKKSEPKKPPKSKELAKSDQRTYKAASSAPAVQMPPAIERVKPRQSLFSQLPRRRLTYLRRKSLKNPSSGIPISSTSGAGENSSEKGHMEFIPYWDTLGSCRLESNVFQWANANQAKNSSPVPIGYDKKLGRVYFSSFTLHGKQYNVGDYIVRLEYGSEEVIRIIGAFQATKSFLGRWGGGDKWEKQNESEEIQKRGHPYILTAPMVVKSAFLKTSGAGRKRKSGDLGEELVLGADHGLNIFPLPQWLGEAGEYRKIQVRVTCTGLDGKDMETVVGDGAPSKAPKKGKKGGKKRKSGGKALGDTFICKEVVVPAKTESSSDTLVGLNNEQYALLTASQDVLLSSHVPDAWDARFKAEQVQMVNAERYAEADQFREGAKVKFQYTAASSDDSDGFAEDEFDSDNDDEE